jgi:sigma-B regulation protein RsbU (phosphoserine phosphatase)
VPAARFSVRRHAPAYVALATLFLMSLTAWTRDARDRIDEIVHGADYVSDPFDLDPVTLSAGALSAEATTAGLRDGDIVLAVDGRPVEGLSDYYGALRRARRGDHLRLHVRSNASDGGAERDVSIELHPFTYLGFAKGESFAFYYGELVSIVMPIFCIALGFWVAAVRVGDIAAWQLLLLMLSFAYSIRSSRTIFGNEDAIQPFFTAYGLLFANLAPAALAFFGIAFPERLTLDRRLPWIKWLLFGPLIIIFPFSAILPAVQAHHAARAMVLWPAYHAVLGVARYVAVAAIITFCASIVYKTMTSSSRDARRRLLLLDTGAVLPLLLGLALSYTQDPRRGLLGWSAVVQVLMFFVFFPVTMAYVIVVQRAMDVRVVIRQGVQYVLARGGIRVIQLLLTVAVSIAATLLLLGGTGMVRVSIVIAGMAAIVAIGGRFADRLRGWVDRRFFREAYEADAILSDLAAQVRTMLETRQLLETVAGRIAASLHVPRIAILLNDHGAFHPVYALGYPVTPRASISEQSLTVKRLRKQQHALVDFVDADSWVQLTDDDERAALEQLTPELLLPLSLNDKLLGIMSLGPKQSEEPFSKTDIRLLDSVAAQTGLALENSRLTDAMAAEVAAREKHRRELEIAHEVQERLFPQEYPPIAGLDYAGACRPALGVGGDYYDFILLSKTGLGIAIGDVSGKGIPAALLMATLRAYLRGQTIQHQTDLTVVIANLNRLVYESSAPNRYATFFYAEFDAESRVLNYVDAGHNPPMVFRRADDGRNVVRLETGGPVIGLMEDCCYRQGRVALEPGDVLVAYTDGISEAMNASDDEWGEERLMDAVRANRMLPARALIDRLMVSADAFVGGAPQHDDMTLVVVRATWECVDR